MEDQSPFVKSCKSVACPNKHVDMFMLIQLIVLNLCYYPVDVKEFISLGNK